MNSLLAGRTIVLTSVGPMQPVGPGPKPGALALHMRMCAFCNEADGYVCAAGRTLIVFKKETGHG